MLKIDPATYRRSQEHVINVSQFSSRNQAEGPSQIHICVINIRIVESCATKSAPFFAIRLNGKILVGVARPKS